MEASNPGVLTPNLVHHKPEELDWDDLGVSVMLLGEQQSLFIQ